MRYVVTDPLGRNTSYSRDNRGLVSSMTDTAGLTTVYAYDYYGNLLRQTAPNPNGPDALVSNYTYDASDRVVSQTDPLGGVTSYVYDKSSNVHSVRDPLGNTTTFAYDSLNRLVSETNARQKTRSYTYDVAGNLTRTVDRNGRVVQYVYDKLDRRVQENWQQNSLMPSATATTVQEGGVFNEKQIVGWTANGTTSLSGTFRLTHGAYTTAPIAWNADAPTIQAALEALPSIGAGNIVVNVSTPSQFGRSISLEFRNGKAGLNVPFTSINGSTLSVTPAQSLTMVQQTLVEGKTVSETQSIVITSPNIADSYWYISYAGEVSPPLPRNALSTEVAAALVQFVSIDTVSVTGSLGNFTITFGGAHTNRDVEQIRVDVANMPSGLNTRSFVSDYNTEDELASVKEYTNTSLPLREILYTRDNLGRATNITTNAPALGLVFSLNQTFDPMHNRTSMSAKLNGQADFINTYTYDKLHRLVHVTQTGQAGATWVKPKRVTQAFNALSQRTNITRYESLGTSNLVATTDFTYDTANRLSGIAHKQGATNLNTYALTYDPLSRLTSVHSTADGLTSYGYDKRSQLVSASYSNVYSYEQPFVSTSYDVNGNRNSSGYMTETDNRTTAAPGGQTYVYDDEGNLISATIGSTTWLYTWDHRNRLIEARTAGWASTVVSYEYDAFNRMIRRNGDYWAYDEGINPVMQYGSGPRKYYLWSDAVDDLLAAEEIGAGANILWPLADHQGTIRDIADRNSSTGVTTIANHRKYDAFGKPLSQTNSYVDLIFGYTGKYYDRLTGLQNNLNRWYDPRLGKWISQDPIGFAGGDANLYRYVGNSATNYTDSRGLHWGHHIVVGPIRKLVPKSALDVFNSLDARITNDAYRRHNFGTFNDITHKQYNRAVIKEFEDYLKKNGINPKKMTVDQAKDFVNHLKKLPASSLIRKFNKGVQATADAAKLAAKSAAKSGKVVKAAKGGAKLAKAIPGFDIFFAVAGCGVDGYCKGPVNGTINSVIDAIPFVGGGKIIIELTITGDWIPDAQAEEEPELAEPTYPEDERWLNDFGVQYPNE